MAQYSARQYDASSIGARDVEVVCDRCGCHYHYRLARFGSGAASAPYRRNRNYAQKAAKQASRKDLEHRLEEEAELVPCPGCLWISEVLITGYRRGLYRRWSQLASFVGVFGTACSLTGAWLISTDPTISRATFVLILLGGPALSITIAGLILLVRKGLRARIQPNQDYPSPPRLPHGTPPALVKDPSTGELKPAAPRVSLDGETETEGITFQVGRTELPPVCCECLAPAEYQSTYRYALRSSLKVIIPLCARCSRRWSIRMGIAGAIGLALAAAIGWPVLSALELEEAVFLLLLSGTVMTAAVLCAKVASWLVRPVRARVLDARRGVIRLTFHNRDYVNQVATHEGSRNHPAPPRKDT